MDHTLALIMKSQQGDKEARDTVFKENAGLVYSMAKRFAGRSVEMEDIVQIGSIGLLKAIDRFDISYDVKFSTYAVPMIIGEIRRYLRDDGMLKVSRNLKENCARIYSAREALEKELGREPILEEVAKATELSVDEVVMSMESGAEVESLHKIIYQGDGNDISLMDRLQEKENGQDAALNRIFLDEILKKLDARERQLIGMRYFKDMTQTEIAAEMGISQVQVSRMEKRILKELKKQVGVINSPLVEGGVFSEEVNKKEVTVNGVNSNKKSVRITIILHTLFAIISLLLYIVSYTVLCDLKITFLYFRRAV